MIRYLLTLIFIVSSMIGYAQTTCISDSILAKVVDELIVKDHLQYTVNELDSTLTIYKATVEAKTREVVILKMDKQQYEQVIAALKEDIQAKNSDIKNLRKQSFKAKVVSFLKGFGVGVSLLVIYIVAHKT